MSKNIGNSSRVENLQQSKLSIQEVTMKIFGFFLINLNLLFLINLMQAPQPPIDIKVVLGTEANCQNLINLNIDFSDDKEHVKNLLKEKKIEGDFGKDLVIMFDFYVDQGKEKQAVEFFNQGQGHSPLQILFRHRPDNQEQQKDVTFAIEQFQSFIRIKYRFTNFQENEDVMKTNEILKYFETNGLRLQSHVDFDLKGKISHNKKNRTNVKVDYAKFNIVSNAFCCQSLVSSLTSMQWFQQQFQEVINNPFFQLIKKSKMAKINVKMDSFRRLNKFYNGVADEAKENETKDFKYVNKGIFRQRAEAALVYNNQYLINITSKYQSQDVFIRLLKVYSKFFEKVLNESFYDDD